MATCKQCREFEKCKDDAFMNGAKFDPNESVKYCTGFEPITNSERIRAMSDEELAKECVKQFPMYLWPTEVRTIYFDFEKPNKNNAVNAWLEWLKRPAEEE